MMGMDMVGLKSKVSELQNVIEEMRQSMEEMKKSIEKIQTDMSILMKIREKP